VPVIVRAKQDDSNDDLIRKFKRKVLQDQVLIEVRKREFYKKPSTLKKEKRNEIERRKKYESKVQE